MMKLRLNNIKIVILDIGKTIFDKEKQLTISDKTKSVLKKIKDSNIKVGLCTMRTIKECKELVPFELDFYICLNGAFVMCDNKVVNNLRITNQFYGQNILSYSKNQTYYNNSKALKLARKNGFSAKKKGFMKKPYVITIFNININEINNYKNIYSVSYWENTKTMTLQSKECNKVNAIKNVLNYYNIKSDEMLFFGDGPNDFEVFNSFKYTIMMKNGHPMLKEYSYDVCGECIEDGVCNYLEQNLKFF